MHVLRDHVVEGVGFDELVVRLVGEDLLPGGDVVVDDDLHPLPGVGLALAGDGAGQRAARLAGVVGVEHEGVGAELFAQMVAQRLEELAALAEPPLVVTREQFLVALEVGSRDACAVVGLLGKQPQVLLVEADGHGGRALAEPRAEELRLVLVLDDREVEDLLRVGDGVGVGDVGVVALAPGDVGVGVAAVEALAAALGAEGERLVRPMLPRYS